MSEKIIKRIEKLTKSKEKILIEADKKVSKINKYIEILNKSEIQENDSFETIVYKLYMQLDNIKLVADEINALGYRIKTFSYKGHRKYQTNDITEIITNKDANVDEDLKEVVQEIQKINYGGKRWFQYLHNKRAVSPIKDIEDVFRLLRYLKERNTRNYILILFGMCTGLRIGDIVSLKFKDVVEVVNKNGVEKIKAKEWIKVIEEKRDYNRSLWLDSFVREEIEDYAKGKELHEFIFLSNKKKYGNRPLTPRSVGRIIKSAAKAVGIKENVATHSLRKTFARQIYDAHDDKSYALELVRKILGHKSVDVTRRYLGIDKEEEVKAISKFTSMIRRELRNQFLIM